MAFYQIIVERYLTYSTKIEADNQQEAERIGRELLPSLTADTDDVTVQARAMAMPPPPPCSGYGAPCSAKPEWVKLDTGDTYCYGHKRVLESQGAIFAKIAYSEAHNA